jgi:uncharacterized protein
MPRQLARLALALLVLLTFPLRAETVPTLPAQTGYIDDYAGALTPETRAQLESACRDLHWVAHAQVFLVTVHNLGGESRDQFALDLFNKWKLGSRTTDRGVLILFATDQRQYRIEVAYALKGVLDDAKVGDVGREMAPSIKAADYNAAARIAVDDIAEYIATDATAGLNPPRAVSATTPASVPNTSNAVVGIVLCAGFATLAALWNVRRRFIPRTVGPNAPFPNQASPTSFDPDTSNPAPTGSDG